MERDGIFFATHPDVYRPSDDTFLLADAVAAEVKAGDVFVEVGCGAGYVALVAARRGAQVYATDANPAAVVLARDNAKANHLEIKAIEGDLLAGIAVADVVAFNPPYLPTAEEDAIEGPLNLAFDGGADGNVTALRFAAAVLSLERPPRVVLIVHSSLSDPAPLIARFEGAGYDASIALDQPLPYERLTVRRFRRR